MKRTLIILVTFVACLAALGAQARDPVAEAVARYFNDWPANGRIIPQEDVVAKVAAGEAMTLLDIRSAADYARGHLRGAINLPWGTAALAENLRHIPQSGQVFVYCFTGQTSGQAVALLNMAGVPAQSVRLGWNLGISRVAGVENVTSTTGTALDTSRIFTVNPALEAAYRAYYSDMAGKVGTRFANNIIVEAEAKRLLDSGDRRITFVSIQRPADFAAARIEGAVNIPWGRAMHEQFGTLPARNTLIVYCYTGQTAGQTVAALRLLGYDAVSLRGGMGMPVNVPQGWANQGLPVVR
ncbi:MAG TPA: rhodanese-like domain-containing protein [Bryobacteraceae bacterium]|nr:rhodanese-like domain-containing protein [Bryobacteraceae bacterium]